MSITHIADKRLISRVYKELLETKTEISQKRENSIYINIADVNTNYINNHFN